MANWEKLIEERYAKKNKISVSTLYEMIDLELESAFQDGVIQGHPGKRLSTKGKKKAGGDPFDQDPPKERSKSAPAGFGVLEEDMLTEGRGEELEAALVAAFNGETPKHFQNFVSLVVKDLKSNLSGRAEKLEKGKISSFWQLSGGRDATSKADIKLGEKRVSMKLGPSAPLFGFGPGDAKATMAAALRMVTLDAEQLEQANELKVLLSSLETAVTRAPLSILKKARDVESELPDDADAALAQVGGDAYKMDQDARSALARKLKAKKKMTEIDSATQAMLGINTTKELLEHAKDILEVEQRLEAIEDEVVKVMNPDNNRALLREYYKEALTSRVKFGGLSDDGTIENPESPNIADSVFITQNEDVINKNIGNVDISKLYVFKDLDDAQIEKIANAASWRGRFRSDSIKEKVNDERRKTGYNKLRAAISAEIKRSSEEGKKYLKSFEDMLVSEGVLSEQELNEIGIGAALAKGKQAVKSIVAKGAKYWASFMERLNKFMNSLMGWLQKTVRSISGKVAQLTGNIKSAISGGLPKLMEFYGIETSDYLDAASEPPQSPPAGILFN